MTTDKFVERRMTDEKYLIQLRKIKNMLVGNPHEFYEIFREIYVRGFDDIYNWLVTFDGCVLCEKHKRIFYDD